MKFDVRTRLFKHPSTVAIGEHSKIIAYPGETNSPHAAYRNPPNWEMLVWRRYLRPGDLFVDVGANIGIYTIYLLDLGVRVIAFEPDRHNADRIRENLRLNGYTAEVIQKAVADRPGVVRFTEGLDSYNHLVLSGTQGVEVEATTLDAALGSQLVHGMKVDVEGAERLVLEGAHSALAERRIKLLQLEWTAAAVEATLHEDRRPVADLLRGHGYVFYRPERHRADLHKITGPVPTGTDVFASACEL